MNRCERVRALAAALVVIGVASALGQAAFAGPGEAAVPAAIEVPDGHKLFLVGHAVGVQIYSCDATASGYAWNFVAPRAQLYNDDGKLLATHFRGPTWQARDGSYVVGSVVGRATLDADAIPWLLLSRITTGAGSDGDRLVATTYIQRLTTTGGLAPAASSCNATSVGRTEEVPYGADYYFWKRTGS